MTWASGKSRSPKPDSWTLFSGHYDGHPLVGRLNKGVQSLVGSPTHNIRVGIAVPVHAPDKNGFPQAGELDQLAAFEDGLIERTRDEAVLVGVITTRSMREFVLYTGSDDWIPAAHADLIALLPTHEVQMVAESDPSWSVYRGFVEA